MSASPRRIPAPKRRCGCWPPLPAPRASIRPPPRFPPRRSRKFTTRSNDVTLASQGPLRYTVDPDGFRIGDAEIAAGNSQVVALAKSLHALQVGQLIIAPGLTEPEAAAFVTVANADPARGARRRRSRAPLLGSARVSHIAVVEVSLRASEEERACSAST